VVVVVLVLVLVVVVLVVQAVQTLPEPTDVPPVSAHVASSCTSRARLVVQSASVSQACAPSLLQTPSATAFPGVASLHVPVVLRQQTTLPALPQVERAAQRATVCRASLGQSDFRS